MALCVSSQQRGCYVVVSVAGEVDLSNADELSAQLLDVVDSHGQNVVVDLQGVPFIDSTGLSALVTAWKRAKHLGGTIHVAAPQPPVTRVLRITDLDTLFEIFSSVEAACADGPTAPPEP